MISGEPVRDGMAAQAAVAAQVAALQAATEEAGGLLAAEGYRQVQDLFAACRRDPQRLRALQSLAPEYGRPEFLACLDRDGHVVPLRLPGPADWRPTPGEQPDAGQWFRPVEPAAGARAWLPARWLCHLAGLRHPTVQLFIDLPDDPGRTLIQIRGLDRPVAPGCFDMPVAGHVAGLASPAEALAAEMVEELGLGPDDVTGLAPIGHYDHHELAAGFSDREHRFVYRCRLQAGRFSRIRFVDAEVAGIAIFALPELHALLARFPDRVASGLRASLPLYV